MNLRSKLENLPLQEGDAVVIGLSGGADSVCLTHLLLGWEGISLYACHLNHSLRGEESERDAQFVRSFCEEWRIPCVVEKVCVRDLAVENGWTLEEAGREARYAFFERTAERLGQDVRGKVWIATAHTLSDQAETVLFRMARGTGHKGMCGIPGQRGRILRPLLGISREEVEAYCSEHRLSYVTDSTNLSADYSRNRIRLEVIPPLKKINPAAERHIGQMAELFREEEAWLDGMAREAYQKALCIEGLSLAELSDCHPALCRRMLALFLETHRLPASFDRVETLYQMVRAGKGRSSLSANYDVVCERGLLRTERPELPCPYFEERLHDGLYQSKTGKVYKIKTLDTDTSALVNKIYKNVFDIFLDCGKISGSVTIRQKRPRDEIRLAGRGCTKSLKKLFQESGIRPDDRLKQFVAADETGVVAVEGFGVAERICCDPMTTKAVEIRLVKGTEKDEG